MLTKEENWLNLKCIHFLSLIRLLPLEMCEKSGRIKIHSDHRRYPLTCYLALNQLNIIYTLIRLLLALSENGKDAIPAVPRYFLCTFLPQVGTVMGIRHFFTSPEVTCTIFNSFFQSCSAVTAQGRQRRAQRQATRRFFRLSFMEMITVVLPITALMASVIILTGVVYMDRLWPVTWDYRALENCLLISIDAITIFSWMYIVYFSFHLQLLCMEKFLFVLADELRSSR